MSTKLKILIISGIFPPDIGGPAYYVPKIANELVKRGHHVEVVCLTERFHIDDNDKYKYKVHRILRSLFKPWRILKTIYISYKIGKKSDIIFANTLSLESYFSALISGTPIVHKIVGDYAWERLSTMGKYTGTIEQFQNESKHKIRFLKFIMNIFPIQNSNALIAPSIFTKNMISKWGISKEKIYVIYNSVSSVELDNSFHINLKNNHNRIFIITIGRLIPLKGIIELIKVIKNIDVDLIIVGSGPLKVSIKMLIKDMGLESRIYLINKVSNEEVHNLLKFSDIFVLNSFGENFPNVILEAMINKIPVICTDVGGCNEIVDNGITGIIIPPNSEEKLYEAINLLLKDSKQLEALRSNAYKLVTEKFSFENMANETESLLYRVVNGNLQNI